MGKEDREALALSVLIVDVNDSAIVARRPENELWRLGLIYELEQECPASVLPIFSNGFSVMLMILAIAHLAEDILGRPLLSHRLSLIPAHAEYVAPNGRTQPID